MRRTAATTMLLLGLLAALLTGCASPEPVEDDHVMRPRPGDTRSLVFVTPSVRRASDRLAATGELPWYADRADAELGVVAGTESPRLQHSHRRVIDRQYILNGRPAEHYSSTRYRHEVQQGVR